MASPNALDSPDSYAIAWIAALPIERAAAAAMLDEEHAALTGFIRHQTDANAYTWGRVGEHNVVIASLASGVYGTTSAAITASGLLASFPSIRAGFLVGISPCGPPLSFNFGLKVPDGLCRFRTPHRDIVRTIVTTGQRASWKSLELPDIWDTGQLEYELPETDLGRDGDVIRPGPTWWVGDKEIWTEVQPS